jgi:hypothetical protein
MAQWFGVRCVFTDGRGAFEERITVWPAESFDEAVSKAEAEALDYADDEELQYLDFAQAYVLPDPPGPGAEVFSLTRNSDLDPEDYLDAFFDTGAEDEASLDELDDVEPDDEGPDDEGPDDEGPDDRVAVVDAADGLDRER